MITLNIYCDEFNFSPLADAFLGEFKSNAPLALEIIFCEEEEIKELNAQNRNINAVTDVLSFPTLDGIKGEEIKAENFPFDIDENGNLFIGSIAICVQRAKQQAEEYGHSYNRELHYLAAHGICHLLGYDHMQDDEKAEMRALEEKVLAKINITRF
ncbi:MAG: rRNA maturation RNase YbeY [Clostridiales bacterium]|nr:rRNA maturation RNase YbeY [Clostridiales bacterium]